ncbi:MAG: hypothetical protein COV36_03895 [Alphaproteobacteria bacterium CG11_big_fil_rev_8_21_14_0_20_44_7]|nr:MAG: hypothetical protein COV36_03895 [Alphaproteobacteria bacterium CG11_big_fil_rev_8_21_14_0_20_44_7]
MFWKEFPQRNLDLNYAGNMQETVNFVDSEKNRLEAALQRVEEAIEAYSKNLENKAVSKVSANSQTQIDALKEKITGLDRLINEKNEEISHLSGDVVRLKDENRKLRDLNKKVAIKLGDSIKEIESLVA